MATNRIIQAVYDLKDNITAKLSRIGDALKSNRADSNKTADSVERDNKRSAESYKKTADSIGGLRKALGALAAFAGLSKLKDGLLAILATGDKFELLGKRFEAVFGGVEQGAAAFEKIKQLAKDTPQTLDQVANAAVKLKAFGLDPLDGTLQALIDQNAKLGGSNEDLQNTILAVGQAWTKQKLQGDDIRQLLEKGVPVYELLSKATGKTAQEIQKMASAGELGRDSIRALLTEIGKSSAGAAGEQMKTLTGLVSNLRDTFDSFLVRIANAGALDFVKAKLTALGDAISGLAGSGKLEQIATSISSAIVGTGQALASTVKFVYDYSSALVLLAKAYAFVKVQSYLDGIALVASGTTRATGIVRALATAITAIPAVRLAVIGGSAVALASSNLKSLGQVIAENLPAMKRLNQRAEEMRLEILQGAEVFRAAADKLAKYRNEQLLSAAASAKLSTAERKAQAERYAGLEQYLKLQIREYENRRRADGLNEEGLKYLEGLKVKLDQVTGAYATLAEGARIASDALDNKLTGAAQAIAEKLSGIGESSKEASEQISTLIGDFDKLSIVEIGDIALAVQKVGEESEVSARRVSEGLGASLSKLSGADLLKFQLSASAAFEEVGRGGEKAAVVLGTTLRVAMERLKVDASKTGEAFTVAGKDIIASFQTVAENGQATAQQIEAAFHAALGGVKTRQEAEALGAALQAAANTGQIGIDALERSTRQLGERIRTIAADLSPLESQFELLGIKSQAQLNAVRDNARDAFDAIVDGAREGVTAQEDVVRAFKAYSDAAVAAAADSSAAAKEQVQVQLQAKAAALGIADAMEKAGTAGKTAGDSTAAAFGDAKDQIEGAADAAANLKDKAGKASDGLDELAESAKEVSRNSQQAGIGLGYMTEEAGKAFSGAKSVDDINNAMGRYKDQIFATKEELDAFTRSQNAAGDAAENAAKQLSELIARMRDQADQASGNAEAIEDRRYRKELDQIEELAAASGVAERGMIGEARALAEQEHKRRLKEIQERKRAEIDAARETSAARDQSETSSTQSAEPSRIDPRGVSSITELRVTVNGNAVANLDPNAPAFQSAVTSALIQAMRQAAFASGAGSTLTGG